MVLWFGVHLILVFQDCLVLFFGCISHINAKGGLAFDDFAREMRNEQI